MSLSGAATRPTLRTPARLSPEVHRRLARPSNARGTIDLVGVWAGVAAAIWLAYLIGTSYAFLGLAIAIGALQHRLLNLGHEAWHSLCLHPRRLNDWVGAWLYGYPIGQAFHHDRARHLRHHRELGQESDPERSWHSNEGRETPLRMCGFLLHRLLGLLFFSAAWSAVVRRQPRVAVKEAYGNRNAPSPLSELVRIGMVQLLLAALMWWSFSWWTYLVLWFLPAVTLTVFLSHVRTFIEHATVDDDATEAERLRDFDAGLVERFFLAPCNFHYHALHHAYPAIPHHRLKAAKADLVERYGEYPYPVWSGYSRSLWTHLAGLGAKHDARPAEAEDQLEPGTRDSARGSVHVSGSAETTLPGIRSNIAKQSVARCPACESSGRRQILVVEEHEYDTTTDDNFPLHECLDCGAWYLDPRPHTSTLDIIYPPNYYAYVLDRKSGRDLESDLRSLYTTLNQKLFHKRVEPISKHKPLNSDTRWLEVGCGKGVVLDTLSRVFGCRPVGVDMSAAAIALCKARGFTAYASRFEEFVPPSGETYDVIHSAHLIEHVVSPLAYLQKAFELLEPGGICAYVTPNTSTWEARFFGRHWGGLHAPRHWTMLNPRSATALAVKTGFEVLALHFSTNGVFWIWSLHSLLRATVGRKCADVLFPSDDRIVSSSLLNVLRTGIFTVLDFLNVLVLRQSSNMLVVLRKPAASGRAACEDA